MFEDVRVLFKIASDLATGVPARLWRSCFQVVKIELVQPSIIRLTVAFAEAVYTGEAKLEEINAHFVPDLGNIKLAWQAYGMPIMTDCIDECVAAVKMTMLVDATLAKRNIGTRLNDAPFVVG